jgi:hypothetical protein
VLLCLALALAVYNSGNVARLDATTAPGFDYLGASLFISSVVPILVGLSLASSTYSWRSWQALLPVSFGFVSLLGLVCKELCPIPPFKTFRQVFRDDVMLLGLRDFKGADALATFLGALMVGVVVSTLPSTDCCPGFDIAQMYALLFFLPIYFLVVKQHTRLQTALFLLPQTIPILPCAFMVLTLADRHVPPGHIVLLGWFFTSCGVGLLSTLDAKKSALCDVLVNILSGLGIGTLLPSLTLSARDSIADAKVLQAQTLLISLRYLGNALGLVVVGIAFQLVLKHNLRLTKFGSRAADMTKHATALVYSVRRLNDAEDVEILVRAVRKTLEAIWIALAVACLSVLFFSCAMAVVARRSRRRSSAVAAETHS